MGLVVLKQESAIYPISYPEFSGLLWVKLWVRDWRGLGISVVIVAAARKEKVSRAQTTNVKTKQLYTVVCVRRS